MSKQMMRSIDRWQKCDPNEMTTQSEAAIFFAFRDAQHDMLLLAATLERIAELCEGFEGCPVAPSTIAQMARAALAE